jgi:LmbE family N-acetylglucosaminyl deacetylase
VVVAAAEKPVPVTGPAGSAERCLSIVAHPDDDLLFVIPDTAQAIRRGAPTTVVFVSAGEVNGNGTTRERYADSRRRGACAAYAAVAAVAGAPNAWTRSVLAVAGRDVEMNTLAARPAVRLVFLGLPDGGDDEQFDALARMWADPAVVARTLRYPGSPVAQRLRYRRADLVAVLAALVVTTSPSVIRVQDSDPDPFLRGEHADHVAVARFAAEALDTAVRAGGPPALLVRHRCYNTADMPVNLTPAVVRAKRAAFDTYLPFDSGAIGQPGWTDRGYLRWDLGTSWAAVDGAGVPHVFLVRGGSVWHWRQAKPGGSWTGPAGLGGGPIAPTLTTGVDVDGRVRVFGVALDSHDVVTCAQTDDGFSRWRSLGNPNGPGGAHTGAPSVGVNADGRLQVFAKNSGGGVSTTYETGEVEAFSSWVDFGGGPGVQETPALLLGGDGRMALFAVTRTGVLGWDQLAPNAGWSPASKLLEEPVTSAPSAVLNADGRPEFFHRAVGGEVHTAYVTPAGSWTIASTGLGGDGAGPVACALGADGRIVLAARNTDAGISVTWQRAPNSGFGAWRPLDGPCAGSPALVVAADGSVLALMAGVDGVLYVSSFPRGPGFGPWQPLPSRVVMP